MDIAYRLSGIDFRWDQEKAELNFRKHGIAFETACEVFFDPFITFIGLDIVRGEEREAAVGMTTDWKLLRVIYVFSPACIRLISARPVTIHERRTYERQ